MHNQLVAKHAPNLNTPVNNVLDPTLDFLSIGGPRDLFKLCLVSRRLYTACIPWIYRRVTLDLERIEHRRMIRKLAHTKTCIPTFIRELTICNLRLTEDPPWRPVYYPLRRRLTQIRSLKLREMPRMDTGLLEFLDGLNWNRPGFTFLVEFGYRQPYLREFPPRARLTYNILKHSCVSVFSSLDLNLADIRQLYPYLKEDLVHMLTRSPNLKELHLFVHFVELILASGASRNTSFGEHKLPRPNKLMLFFKDSSLFSVEEIQTWAAQGAFEDLSELCISHMEIAVLIVTQARALQELVPRPIEYADTDHMQRELYSPEFHEVFSKLQSLRYCPMYMRTFQPWNRRVVPWFIVRRAVDLRCLDVSCPEKREFLSSMLVEQEIKALRTFCPELESLTLRVELKRLLALWPFFIVKEVARFLKLKTVDFYVHYSGKKPNRCGTTLPVCALVAHTVRKVREHLRLNCETNGQSIEVGFKKTKFWKRAMQWDAFILEYVFSFNKNRVRGTYLELDKLDPVAYMKLPHFLTVANLQDLKDAQWFKYISWDGKKFGEEIERRMWAGAEAYSKEYSTFLYEKLMDQE